jgi:hypothetical protein
MKTDSRAFLLGAIGPGTNFSSSALHEKAGNPLI